jgi:peroxin-5
MPPLLIEDKGLNIGVHREAAEHFLAALSLSRTGDGGQDEYSSIYGPLRRALVSMNMEELAERLRPGVDLEIFRQAGFEF